MWLSLLEKLGSRGRVFWLVTSSLLVIAVGVIDTVTGYEYSVLFFYLIPIALATWFQGRLLGLTFSIVSSAAWVVADITSGQQYSSPAVIYWNAMIRFGFFVVVVLLLPLMQALEREKQVARTDHLTGVVNRLSLQEAAEREMENLRRSNRPFTLAYIDLDNFKVINDRYGHSTGDQALRIVASQMREHLRKTATVARLGGDEFAVLLPDTDQESARVAISRIQRILGGEMAKSDWPLTFSIGVLSCKEAPESVEDLIKRGDELMYAAKNGGKDAVRYGIYPE